MSKKPSRSIRRFHNKLEKSVDRHAEKLDGRLSLPQNMGKLVVVVSNAPDRNSSVINLEQKKAFNDEADLIAEKSEKDYSKVEIRRKATMDLVFDLADPEVSGLVMIGHGSIGDFWLDSGKHFGWEDFAKNTKYLKQSVIQRVCGHYATRTSVASGTFVVADQRNVIAPHGQIIDDINPDESLFVPVYDNPVNSASDILNIQAQYLDGLDEDK